MKASKRERVVIMEGLRKMVLLWLMVLMMAMLCMECRQPVLHRVGGGKYTWAPNINFSDWSTHQHFYVGDWLYFGFDKHKYNVLEVNQTSYEKCIDKNFIKNITQGGRDVFNLTEAKPYYFICSGDYCFHGMKLAVNVEDIMQSTVLPPPSIAPKNGSPSKNTATPIILIIIYIFLFECI